MEEEVMADIDLERIQSLGREIGKRAGCDIFLYNGDINRRKDLDFIYQLNTHKKTEICRIILVTDGGDPDAAYKIARYVQEKYKTFEVLISGHCKSAGTLIAMGAHALRFTPYGELGPLDVQIFKEDKLSAMHSGLNISEALQALERRATETYINLVGRIVANSGGVISFPTASKSASDILISLYGPIFARIDPEDVGSRTRSMRIAMDYGQRLDVIAKNLKPNAIKRLAETYSSHSFVIDKVEAERLFKNVKAADDMELELVGALGDLARWQVETPKGEPIISCLSAGEESESDEGESKPEPGNSGDGSSGTDGAHPEGTGTAASAESGGAERDNTGRPAAARLRAIGD